MKRGSQQQPSANGTNNVTGTIIPQQPTQGNNTPVKKTGFEIYLSKPGNKSKTMDDYLQARDNALGKHNTSVKVTVFGSDIIIGNVSSADLKEMNKNRRENDDKTKAY